MKMNILFYGSELLQRAQSDAIIISNKGTGSYESSIEERINFSYPQGSLKQWKNLGDIELYGSPSVNWMVNFLPIAFEGLQFSKLAAFFCIHRESSTASISD